jgi:uncharacterized protein YgfB (UPF0149 family)
MANREVEQKTTPVSEPELVATIISAAKQMFDVDLTKPQVAVLIAHINLETGSSGAGWQGGGVGNTSMHNYNLGNIQWTPGSGYDYFLGGDRTKDAQGNWVKTHFKFLAFPTLEDGVKFYLHNIHNRGGGAVWNAILHADPSAFAHALKQTHYYEEDEKKYDAAMQARLKNFNKGKSYELALSKAPSEKASPSLLADRSSEGLEGILEKFLRGFGLAASEQVSLKKLYKEALPNHNILIQINTPDHTSAVEFSRVLCTALDEDLLSTSYPHTDGNLVEVECSISGPQKECFEAVQQMTQAVAETFKDATSKVGGIVIKNKVIMNKKSSYQPISPRTAGTNYRKFLLKFV